MCGLCYGAIVSVLATMSLMSADQICYKLCWVLLVVYRVNKLGLHFQFWAFRSL